MIEVYGKHYYIDLDAVTDRCRIEKKEPKKTTKRTSKKQLLDDEFFNENDDDDQQINIFKYELIKLCLQRLFDEVEIPDDDMGAFGAKNSTVSFKIAFNTLIKYQILIEAYDE